MPETPLQALERTAVKLRRLEILLMDEVNRLLGAGEVDRAIELTEQLEDA